jgi:hypothetical protein
MELNKIAGKPKANKATSVKKRKASASKGVNEYGINLTLDNSLSKYANESFIVEHNARVSKKFAQK